MKQSRSSKKKILLYFSIIGLLLLSLLIAISIGVLFFLISKEERELANFDNQIFSEIDSVFNELSSQIDNRKKEINQCFIKMERFATKDLFNDQAKEKLLDIIKDVDAKFERMRGEIRSSFEFFNHQAMNKIDRFSEKYNSFVKSMERVIVKSDLERIMNQKLKVVQDSYKARIGFESNQCVTTEYMDFLSTRGNFWMELAEGYMKSREENYENAKCKHVDFKRCEGYFKEQQTEIKKYMYDMFNKYEEPSKLIKGITYLNIEGKRGIDRMWPTHSFSISETGIKVKKDNEIKSVQLITL